MKKKFLIIFILFTSILATCMTSSQAVQSIPNSVNNSYKTSPSEFFSLIRQMETSSGPMGLNATVDETGTETSGSNKIDVHMIKNTEWGAMAMLAASSYGNKTGTGETYSTALNNSGVFQTNVGDEYTAGMWDMEQNYTTNIYNAPGKYWDKYTETKNKIGDTTLETKDWNSAYKKNFIEPGSARTIFVRSLFGYDNVMYIYKYGQYNWNASRAAIVCGDKF